MCFLTQKDHAIDQYNTQMIIIPGQTLVFPEDWTVVFRRILEIAKSDYWFRHYFLSVCLSIRMEHLGSQ